MTAPSAVSVTVYKCGSCGDTKHSQEVAEACCTCEDCSRALSKEDLERKRKGNRWEASYCAKCQRKRALKSAAAMVKRLSDNLEQYDRTVKGRREQMVRDLDLAKMDHANILGQKVAS